MLTFATSREPRGRLLTLSLSGPLQALPFQRVKELLRDSSLQNLLKESGVHPKKIWETTRLPGRAGVPNLTVTRCPHESYLPMTMPLSVRE
jgi:hypothetical protein